MWTAGETVEVRLTFGEPVSVNTAGGTPSIGLRLGGAEVRSAEYASGSGTVELVFGYTLAEGEGPHNAMLVPGNSLALNGGAIVSAADGTVAADLTHNGTGKVGGAGVGAGGDARCDDARCGGTGRRRVSATCRRRMTGKRRSR